MIQIVIVASLIAAIPPDSNNTLPAPGIDSTSPKRNGSTHTHPNTTLPERTHQPASPHRKRTSPESAVHRAPKPPGQHDSRAAISSSRRSAQVEVGWHRQDANDAFQLTPKTTPIPTPRERDPNTGSRNAKIGTDEQEPPDASAVFDEPAHFPLPAFGPFAEFAPQNALIIYEGMTLNVFQHGKYEVRFVAEAPQTPVVVRLQLRLDFMSADNLTIARTSTITLPPITIRTDPDADPLQPSKSWRITHNGRSSALLRAMQCAGACALRGVNVSRAGTARFGSIPQR
jgi:hypothetical protein